ncbi:hypothetical protein [Fluviicola taffensis]|uniref:hypothetical protein n=1 Tax=Fluviicola taffensis TaxID=191579 RepID=UPI003137CBBE
MSFTVDFILLFILVVIPGLIFKRFFFFGEFSKQYTTKESIYKSLFYSIIPGILIQLFSYWFYITIHDPWFNTEDVLTIFKELFSNKTEYSISTERFFKEGFNFFLLHEVIVFTLAGFIGLIFSRLIRLMRWDIHFKIFRFQNQWYYVFSGEIKRFKKFKHLKRILGEVDGEVVKTNQTHFPPYGDILVEDGGQQNLYTGFIVDYDLDYEDVNNLDRIYLIGASRYRLKRDGEDLTNLDVRGSRVKVPIKGDVFILEAKNILNMNLTFIPTKQLEKVKSEVWQRINKVIYFAGLFIYFLAIIYFSFINSSLLNSIFPNVTWLLVGYGFFARMLIALTIVQIISLIIPSQIDIIKGGEKENISKENQSNYAELIVEFEDDAIELKQTEEQKIRRYDYSWKDFGLKIIYLLIFIGLMLIFF